MSFRNNTLSIFETENNSVKMKKSAISKKKQSSQQPVRVTLFSKEIVSYKSVVIIFIL